MLRAKELLLPNDKLVDFSLDDQGLVVLKGPNGSGKSLLLRSLALLERVSYKELSLNGKGAQEYSPDQYRSKVLYVPSGTYGLELTVPEYLELPRKLSVYRDQRLPDGALEMIRSFGLPMEPLKLLSLGQRQLLSLIRALHLNASVLLLDEPTSHLDSSMVREARRLILEWKDRTGGAVVVVAHGDSDAEGFGTEFTEFESLVREKERLTF